MFLMLPLWGSGSGTYVRKLAQTMAKRGYEVAIACPDRRKLSGVKTFPIDIPFMAVYGAHPEHPGAPKYPDLTSQKFNQLYAAFHHGFTRAVEKFQPDVIHAHHAFFPSWIADYCRAIYRTHYLTTVHGTDVYNASLDHRYVTPTREALQQADLITVVSPQTRGWMFRVFGRSFQAQVRTILGGVDTRAFPKHGQVSKINTKYRLGDRPVVLFTGRLFETKGVSYLIQAANRIDAEIVIVGDGPERKNLERQAKGLPNIHFTGYVAAALLPEFYRRANVLVVPSVWDEPLGLISLEAMSSSTPVVASNKGGIGLAVRSGHNGFLIRARSAKAIADAVNRILNNPSLAKKLGWNARKFIEKKFSWEVIADQFAPHYDAVARNTRKRQGRQLPLSMTAKDAAKAKREIRLSPENEKYHGITRK